MYYATHWTALYRLVSDPTILHFVLHCAVLSCIALNCIVLVCIVTSCLVSYCVALHCIILHCLVLHCIVGCMVMYCLVVGEDCIVLCWIVLHCIIVCSIAWSCCGIMLDQHVLLYVGLYFASLDCSWLYWIVLYCIARGFPLASLNASAALLVSVASSYVVWVDSSCILLYYKSLYCIV